MHVKVLVDVCPWRGRASYIPTSVDSGIPHCGKSAAVPHRHSCPTSPAGPHTLFPSSQNPRTLRWPVGMWWTITRDAAEKDERRDTNWCRRQYLSLHVVGVLLPAEKLTRWCVFNTDAMLSKHNKWLFTAATQTQERLYIQMIFWIFSLSIYMVLSTHYLQYL